MSELPKPLVLKCPVCSAGFRGATHCSRCGTDLSVLMRIAARAWQLRQRSRQALLAGNLEQALRCLWAAQRLQRNG